LAKYQTMNRAAVILRVTQSAVSKRLSTLENMLGYPVIERHGRNIILTSAGHKFLALAAPLASDLREVMKKTFDRPSTKPLIIGLSESLASQETLRTLHDECRATKQAVVLHCHRSPMVYDLVVSGAYQAGICVRDPSFQNKTLVIEHLFFEPMYLVEPNEKATNPLPLWFIEKTAHSGKQLDEQLANIGLAPDHRIESFSVLGQFVKAGICRAVLPASVARSIGVRAKAMKLLKPKVNREIIWLSRKNSANQSLIRAMRNSEPYLSS
jgi:DNA-binding transcriptional LysR family regulator